MLMGIILESECLLCWIHVIVSYWVCLNETVQADPLITDWIHLRVCLFMEKLTGMQKREIGRQIIRDQSAKILRRKDGVKVKRSGLSCFSPIIV